MAKKNPQVDVYIAGAMEFARPVLTHFRKLVHQACPAVEETIKWGMPHFVHRGNLCGMAAFKAHCSIVFWRRSLIFKGAKKEGMGAFGRITSMKDLPGDREMLGYLREAVRLNEEGIKPPQRKEARAKLLVPEILIKAFKKNARARKTFENFSPSHQKEYAEWISEAKTEPTREKRLATTLAWLEEGKPRNWKYMKC